MKALEILAALGFRPHAFIRLLLATRSRPWLRFRAATVRERFLREPYQPAEDLAKLGSPGGAGLSLQRASARLLVYAVFCYLALAATSSAQTFDFGKLPASVQYSAATGYGFEPGAAIASDSGCATTDKPPFYFSIKVPSEGNYKVTVKLGGASRPSVTTVKAELRRLMLENVRTDAGESVTRTFIVNTRTPEIGSEDRVRLKDREKTSEAWAWDDRVTLEFTGEHPSLCTLEVGKAGPMPTIYIAGDSTSTDQPLEPYNSWGQMLTRFFKPEVAVANHGESGESLRGFLGEHRLEKIDTLIQPGDYLFIQMGHNDQKERGEGVGAFTTYKADLKRFVADARRHGATPVLVTSMHRLSFEPGTNTIANSLGDYPEAVRQVAKEENVALIDLNAMSKPFYEALGPANAHLAFAGSDKTHHSDYGSYELARCIVQGIKDSGLPLARYLVDLPKFDPSHPDPVEKFDVPPEPPGPPVKPYGQ